MKHLFKLDSTEMNCCDHESRAGSVAFKLFRARIHRCTRAAGSVTGQVTDDLLEPNARDVSCLTMIIEVVRGTELE